MEQLKKVSGVIPEQLDEVDTERLNAVSIVEGEFQNYRKACEELESVEKEVSEIKAELEGYAVKYNYKICSNCGTVVM